MVRLLVFRVLSSEQIISKLEFALDYVGLREHWALFQASTDIECMLRQVAGKLNSGVWLTFYAFAPTPVILHPPCPICTHPGRFAPTLRGNARLYHFVRV